MNFVSLVIFMRNINPRTKNSTKQIEDIMRILLDNLNKIHKKDNYKKNSNRHDSIISKDLPFVHFNELSKLYM